MADFLKRMDVMLAPSRDEGVMRETFSQAAVQGMLSGCPLIVSDLAILTEKINEGGGLVAHSPEEMAAAMGRLASDAELRVRMGEKARRVAAARYIWRTDEFVKRYLFPA
jgi:glycosyltransferase involved in cell wall biosynthesis